MKDLYKNCRWCKSFQNGKCCNETFSVDSDVPMKVYQLFEDGLVYEAIKEACGEHELDEDAIQSIEDAVCMSICTKVDKLVETSEVEISDPENFYCKYFK